MSAGDLIIEDLDFYSFFTKYSLLEEYGFTAGVIKRIFRKILPVVHEPHTIEYHLLHKDNAIPQLLTQLQSLDIVDHQIGRKLDLSIQALCTKVIAFGLDSNIKAKYSFLDLDPTPFMTLLDLLSVERSSSNTFTYDLRAPLQSIEILIVSLRKNKNRIGTNFHLTLVTRRILDYIARIYDLLDLKSNLDSSKHWEKLFLDFLSYEKRKHSISRFYRRHADLVALEIVEHTAQKGENYVADSNHDYLRFFYKSLLGGAVIALFALLKIFLDDLQLSQMNNAFYFSLNYAACFVLVKQLGGIIATKQPAMTASTIAKNIDRQDDLKLDSIQSIKDLVSKVFKSQFISIMGNFFMAIATAALIAFILQQIGVYKILDAIDAPSLLKKTSPSLSLAFYAAVAGVFLALSGLLSGYFDNKVVASNIDYRIINSPLFFKSSRFAKYVKLKGGALFGNVTLGFMLGSAFLLSSLFPFAIDIRHIAFSSANIGYAAVTGDIDANTLALAISGALLIGFVNFLVSFSITLFLALKSRGFNFKMLRSQ